LSSPTLASVSSVLQQQLLLSSPWWCPLLVLPLASTSCSWESGEEALFRLFVPLQEFLGTTSCGASLTTEEEDVEDEEEQDVVGALPVSTAMARWAGASMA
jgi:hypothetical protein